MKYDYIIRPRFSVWVEQYRAKYPNIAQHKSIHSLREVWRNLNCLIA